MLEDWRRRRAVRRVKPGDGHPIPRYRWWQAFSRALFTLELAEPAADGTRHAWTVDVRTWGDSNGEVKAQLYRDGRHHAESKLPATFEIPGGVIDVQGSGYGLKRCHFVGDGGVEQQLVPDRRSVWAWRARLHREHRGISRAIGAVSVLVLLTGLVLGVPQIVEQISAIPPVAENIGTFTSPVQLSAVLNIGLVLATLLASTERALRLRYHWLLDAGLFDGSG